MRNEAVHRYTTEAINQLQKIELDQFEDLIEAVNVLKYEFKTILNEPETIPVTNINIQLQIISDYLQEFKNKIDYDGYQVEFYFKWRKEGLIEYLQSFLNSDYFRTPKEKELNDALYQINFCKSMFHLYEGKSLPWNYLNMFEDLLRTINSVESIKAETKTLTRLKDQIVNDNSLYLDLNKQVLALLNETSNRLS